MPQRKSLGDVGSGSGSDDFFDRLPDDVVLSIFDKVEDAKSLCWSMSVCKRFRSIVPQVNGVFLPLPQKKAAEREETRRGLFRNAVIRALKKPFHFISQMMVKSKPKNVENDLEFYSYYVPNEILKSFQGIRAFHLRLPCYGAQNQGCSKTGRILEFPEWKAEFGRELQSCVILGAKSWRDKSDEEENSVDPDQESRVMADEELKLRIVWTISCLIAASARHYLIQETVKGLKTIDSIVVSDESDQGRLCMNKGQIEEMRKMKGKGDELLEYRSRVPALRMKMWYLERLELPGSGKVMEGATLVVIRPAAACGGAGADDLSWGGGGMAAEAFGEEGEGKMLREAVGKLMVAKKCYTLEMNSF
ncbi:F-box protein [Sesamum alatum]|uniref:F-box protein n=1 Tax=Sesamum alatum TaxID=300844 RepID=A0AAE2CEY3_9LAMI|nr:F-box protein [Sesamum alatum]